MKNLLFYSFILLFCSLETKAQPINKNDSSQTNKFVISTDKTRVFYKGLKNVLSISDCDGDNINITVEGAGANMRKVGSGQYEVICTQVGTVFVTVNDGKQTQKLSIPVMRIPDPIAVVGRSQGGFMSANKFRAQGGVIAEVRNFVFEGVKFHVASFTIFIKGKDFDGKDFEEQAEVIGPAFTGGAKELIRKCRPGTTVMIGGIKVLLAGGYDSRQLDQIITFILQ